ncbi:hypothetical protein D0863_10159 [Hortaea werneckii]|uniref:Uncharacterized protein n=1 Tax=Hortaea werneckii TaxID=91943 RepID=A0A3M7DHY6_HORWE|nr:hypothetical protein D0863_10159 [Hortaea werneckii]
MKNLDLSKLPSQSGKTILVTGVLYTSQLAQRYTNLSTIAIHPGVVGTDLVKSLGLADRLLVYATSTMMSPEDGCKESMWGARAPR